MFNKILIANRGEIACRIMKTAKRLGIKTVAVYSDADASARHVSLADAAINIGPAAARESYLVIEKIIAAAKDTAAEAIHPGYGFLSENAEFAHACADNDIVFIGPPASAIAAMGSKSAAKAIMQSAQVPLVPGYHGDDQDPALLKTEANNTGYPVLIKAAAGGGGKGMRVVEQADEFPPALAAAKREAANAFNDNKVLIEKYLLKPRHIEMQIFCDNTGNGVYLFERDCSVQRRHQKVIEEAPAPGLNEQRRMAMGAAALTAAAAIGYVGAGTVEFIVDAQGEFYFMEMNTRLQVEHPITEMVTGQDLVEWQLNIAAGMPLPLQQEQLQLSGHAVEARIYAEDPDNDFLPCTGTLEHLSFPTETEQVRIDTGVSQGDKVCVYYDPMIAKLVVSGKDRSSCLRRMQLALAQTHIVGLTTNLGFLNKLISHQTFQHGSVDTGFIAQYEADLLSRDNAIIDIDILALAMLYYILARNPGNTENTHIVTENNSPWMLNNNWLMNLDHKETLCFLSGKEQYAVSIQQQKETFTVTYNEKKIHATAQLEHDTQLTAVLNGKRVSATIIKTGTQLNIFNYDIRQQLDIVSERYEIETEDTAGKLVSPMPGKIIAIMVEKNQKVRQGEPLLIVEAMKMEHTIVASEDGIIKEIFFTENAMVDEGVELVAIT